MRRSVKIAYAVAAVFALLAIVALIVRPIHFERTFVLGVVVALGAVAYAIIQRSRT